MRTSFAIVSETHRVSHFRRPPPRSQRQSHPDRGPFRRDDKGCRLFGRLLLASDSGTKASFLYSKDGDGAHARIRTGDLFLTKWSSVPGEFESIIAAPADFDVDHLTKTGLNTLALADPEALTGLDIGRSIRPATYGRSR